MRYEQVDLNRLKLDPNNPRLPKRLKHSSDEDIVNWMLSDSSLIELMLAIGTNGFFPGEPLLVNENDDGDLIVVEGNRRLASLLLLNGKVKANTQVGSVDQALKLSEKKPKKIPVIQFDTRQEIDKYLGFRHVTGIKEWSPLAKARYLKSLMNVKGDVDKEEEYRVLAKQIGSRKPYVQRLIVSYNLYEFIEREGFFDIDNLKEDNFHFTYLMDSLNRPEIREFIEVDFDLEDETENLNEENFQQLIEWFFLKRPSTGRPAMNASSSQLSMLCDILSHDKALESFLADSNLKEAHDKTYDGSSNYRESIDSAEEALKSALVNIVDVDEFYPSDEEQLRYLKKCIKNLIDQVTKDI
ncbi:hypothetical protein NMR85_002008 [Vibrio alginolyticus]|nr:hypothetical protein [Vibrio alginolyticus]